MLNFVVMTCGMTLALNMVLGNNTLLPYSSYGLINAVQKDQTVVRPYVGK